MRIEVEPENKEWTKERCKVVLLEKVQLDFESEMRLANVKLASMQQARIVEMIERTKIMDVLFMKHGCRLADLLYAQKNWDLDNDPDVLAAKNANQAKKQDFKQKAKSEAIDKMRGALKVTPEQQAEIDELIAAQGPVNVAPNSEGTLDKTEFMKLFQLICTLQVRY